MSEKRHTSKVARKIAYRGAQYQLVAHTSEEVAKMSDQYFKTVSDVLGELHDLLVKTQASLNAVIQDPKHNELDISLVLAKIGGGVKHNLTTALDVLKKAEEYATMSAGELGHEP